MDSEQRLSELLLRWEELRARGQAVSVEELCSDAPELREELSRRIRAREAGDPVPSEAGKEFVEIEAA